MPTSRPVSSELDLARLRAETPGCAHRIHLNNAGAALMPRPVIDAVQEHLAREAEIGGYEAAAERGEPIAAVYADLAELLGCAPRNLALVENATAGFALALSAIPFASGEVIVTTRGDYASNQIQYLALVRRFGVEVVHAPDTPAGEVDLEALGGLLDQLLLAHRRPRLVAVSHVPTHGGLVQPAAAIGRLCRERGVLYLLDACQTLGQLPLDPAALGCDFLAATSRKFLRGPRGIGLLYVGDRALEDGLEPLLPDLRGADWSHVDAYAPHPTARRFENWEFSYALVLGLGAAARYANRLGIDALSRRTLELGRLCRERLEAVPGVRPADRGSERCAIVALEIPGAEPEPLLAALRARRLNASISYLAPATVAIEARRTSWLLRVSPCYYNTEEEVETFERTLEELLR